MGMEKVPSPPKEQEEIAEWTKFLQGHHEIESHVRMKIYRFQIPL